MSWTKKEELAIIRSMMIIIKADGETDLRETEFLVNTLKAMGEDHNFISLAMLMSDSEMINIIKGFTSDEKKIVKNLWINEILADKKVKQSETYAFVSLAEDCGIDISDFLGR